ncbi:cytochrome b/b6 domain-containing protein [Vibrio sp. SS-MA-C1-2]|uniref:cytochrome b/b6 domain-containing protein n=1 Tax=Vibrio sp. SS-MA-C1-2 TaxID=2908646 RepID=UPI001F2DAABC|nr:cytochrome b/b6 domain-containing protein [Vibrio sp. SS-MA-C1-2]UJF17592.1 cytochrome b/b6 domain-containing protein [Vibrio sp. SS-MA-C1-2]
MTTHSTSLKIQIWDSFVRGYHWLQVAILGGLWYTGEQGLMEWHFSLAYLLMTLLLSRLIWGFIGSDTAKFSYFIKSPATVIRYLKNPEQVKTIGHNPIGSYMVALFFILLTLQITTGLFANDDILSEGPLAQYISYDLSGQLTGIHHQIFNVLQAAVVIHILAIFIYRAVKKENLTTPMITGKKEFTESMTMAKPKIKNGIMGWVIFLMIGSIVYFAWGEEVISYLF